MTLLQMAVLSLRADQRVKDGQHMAAVFDHAREYVAEMRFAFCILVPLRQDRRRNLDVTAQLFRGMSAQEQSIKESRFALRKVQIRNKVGRQEWSDRRHSEKAVYRKLLPRQVGPLSPCCEPVKAWATRTPHATEVPLTVSNPT